MAALGAVGSVVARVAKSRRAETTPPTRVPTVAKAEWPSLVAPALVDAPDAAPDVAVGPAWVDPVAGQCPITHPVKGNASSSIYHVPGSRFYDMTIPERCYSDAAAAEADGMRAPKR